MEKYVPLEKRSKKEQRAWHARQRGNWNGVKPVTRIVPSKKVYSRKKKRQEFPPDVFLFASPVVGTNDSAGFLYPSSQPGKKVPRKRQNGMTLCSLTKPSIPCCLGACNLLSFYP
jgi:hypothetical protein